jgi:hypothetical protein
LFFAARRLSHARHHIGASRPEREANTVVVPARATSMGEWIMKIMTATALALSILAGIAGQVYAQSADEMSANNAKYLDQLDRESRGGQGQ